MKYQEIKPGPAASRFIKCYWVLEDDSPMAMAQTIVPDGRSEVIINLGQPFQQATEGNWLSQPEIFFVGQITGPFVIRPQNPARTIGIRFHPHGAIQLLRVPMFEMTDSAVSIDDVSQSLHRQLDQLRDMTSLCKQLAALERIILAEMTQSDEDRLISVAVGQFERAYGLIGIRQLADWLGLSSRQLERRFKNEVGISPKLFSRMQRFQRVFQTMENPGASWVDAAVSCGYYDQAHLIRDFREFSGTTPAALLTEEFDLMRHFT